MSRALVGKGAAYLALARSQEAIENLRRGVELAKQTRDRTLLAEPTGSLGNALLSNSDLEQAER